MKRNNEEFNDYELRGGQLEQLEDIAQSGVRLDAKTRGTGLVLAVQIDLPVAHISEQKGKFQIVIKSVNLLT